MSSDQKYSVLDRMIHRLAFTNAAVQLAAADLEASLYGSRFHAIKIRTPIFITSLPRAGTTLFLEILTGNPGLATHCYRDMPFVLAPLLWDAMSKGFRKPAISKERAHGDGMTVSYDSPEAFEEILWRTFWPEKFKRNRIDLWQEDETAAEFHEFFVAHMRKIIALRSNASGECNRYVSKNNANVARLRLLRRLFPDCFIVIPFRNPVAQATSLLRQHTRFLARHREDPFAKRYMNDIGHFEFGELHRPIGFDGIDEIVSRYSPDSANYWIAYWIQAFRHIVRYADDVLFVSYERLCERGAAGLRTIEDRMGIQRGGHVSAAVLRAPRSCDEEVRTIDKDLVNQARTVHSELLGFSIV